MAATVTTSNDTKRPRSLATPRCDTNLIVKPSQIGRQFGPADLQWTTEDAVGPTTSAAMVADPWGETPTATDDGPVESPHHDDGDEPEREDDIPQDFSSEWTALEEAEMDYLDCVAEVPAIREIIHDRGTVEDQEAEPGWDDDSQQVVDIRGTLQQDAGDLDSDLTSSGFTSFELPEIEWSDDAPLSLFEAEASQPLWDIEPDEEADQARKPRQKAAEIVGLLEVTTTRERDSALAFLVEFFAHLRHQSTFRAVLDAAHRGLDVDTLRAMVALRGVWLERPEWWVHRRGSRGEVSVMLHGKSALSWPLTAMVARARYYLPPEDMIDDAWCDEWHRLRVGQEGYWSFPEFIECVIAQSEGELLAAGLRLRALGDDPGGANDYHTRCGRLPDPHDALVYLPSANPFDARTGNIVVASAKWNGAPDE